MSELSDAIKEFDGWTPAEDELVDRTIQTIVEAARLVADPESFVADFGKRLLAHESEGKVTTERAQTELLNLFDAFTTGDTK